MWWSFDGKPQITIDSLPSKDVDSTFPWRASGLSLRGKPTPILSAAAVGTDIDLVADPLYNISLLLKYFYILLYAL